jgi:hypothetical protein
MNLTYLRQAALTLAAIALSAPASAQLVNFGQLDLSPDTRTLALVRTLPDDNPRRPDPLLTANYTQWQTGRSASLGYMHRWALTSGARHNWGVGAGVGLNRFETRGPGGDEDTGPSLRAQTELSGPAPGGTYFALLQLSTFRNSRFGIVQYNPRPDITRLGFDLSRYQERGVRQTAFAVRVALDERRRWFFRFGAIDSQDDLQPFIGIAYNAF